MSLVFMDGFDLYADTTGLNENWDWFSAPGFSTTGGRFGGGSVDISVINTGIYKILDNSHNYITVGAAIKPDLNVNGYYIVWAEDGSPNVGFDMHAGVHILTDGTVELHGDGGVVLASTASGKVAAGSWYYIEFSCFRDGASGTADLYINGISELSVTGVDTRDGTAGSYLHVAAYATSNTFSADDVYILTDASAIPTPWGDTRIEVILPDADTAVADLTLSAGSNGYELIDDSLGTNGDGDTTYISGTSGASPSLQSEFDMGSLTGSPATIHAIAVNVRASKTDAGAGNYTPYVISGTAEAAGNDVTASEGTYSISNNFFTIDPNTGGAWTEAAVNAVKLGVRITS